MRSKTKSWFSGSGNFGIVREFNCNIQADFQPYEQQTRDHPGCSAEWIVNSVSFRGVDLPLSLFTAEEIESMAQELMDDSLARSQSDLEEAINQRLQSYKDRKKS